MSETQNATVYNIYGAPDASTAAGTQCGGVINLSITAGTDTTDADVFALLDALLAAFPAEWGVTTDVVTLSKVEQSTTEYATNYTSSPPAFS